MKKTNVIDPLYKVIYKELVKRIENNTYPVQSLVPSESELQEEFGVSRITVRRSLQDLEVDGYIKKVQGKGAYVLPHIPYSDLSAVKSFSEEAHSEGENPSSIIIEFSTVKGTPHVLENLSANEGDDIYYLKRLRLKNNRIIGLNETYISKARVGEIMDGDLDEFTSIYDLYETRGIEIGSGLEVIKAELAGESIAQQLYMADSDPVFKRERVTYDSDGEPIEFSINTYKASEYKYVIKLGKVK